MALVGIDLGGTQLRVAVADDRGRLRTVVRRPTEAARGRQHVIGRIVAAVADALAEDGTPASRVRALGIGLPGPVDPSAGLVISPANLPGFRNVPLNLILTRGTGIRSYLHHDAQLAISILETAGAYLGIAMGTLVNLFNPQLIVLGGSVLKAGAPLLTPMRRSMLASSWKAARRGLRIVRPALGDDVGLIGAVEFARLRARHARLA